MKNDFMTKLPFFELKGTIQISDFAFWQRNRLICDKIIKPVLTPLDYYPEFVFKRGLSTSIPDRFYLYEISGDTITLIDNLSLATLFSYDVSHGAVSYNTITFKGGDSAPFVCGHQYFYVVRFDDDTLYYSEIFEATNFKLNELPSGYIKLEYNSTCTIQGIPYSVNELVNKVWMKTEPLLPEIETNIETTEDNTGNVLSTVETISKKYKLVIPQCVANLHDALSSVYHYVKDSKCTASFYNGNEQQVFWLQTIQSFELEAPDYGTDQCMPTVRFNVSVQESRTEAGCCDDEPICFTGQTFGLPQLSIVGGNKIKFEYGANINPMVECFAICEWKLVASPTWLSTTVLKSQLTSGGYLTSPLASGSYQCRVTFRPSQDGCASNPSFAQTINI